ncbi:MAG: galactokinase [Parcubacteria group bacterium]|nr:galactokinase [Parcubacteria group bacterium]
MIITRTPFRIPLGGGSTDLPSYYEKFGGFIFGVAIKMYFDVFLKILRFDRKIHFQYSSYEAVDSIGDLKHNIGREALRLVNWPGGVDITFKADTPAGTGLGSSGSCAVGLLNALTTFQQNLCSPQELAEMAFQITQRLGWSDGKQDPYLAALGGFTILRIDNDGLVEVERPAIRLETAETFSRRCLLFYTGVCRDSNDVLKDQSKDKVFELKHKTRKIGELVLAAFERGDLDCFGELMDKHWRVKKEMSGLISNSMFDGVYELARANGASGGKLLGAGGGGYFLFYCPNDERRENVRVVLSDRGLVEVPLEIDRVGTRVLLNVM